MGHCTTPEAEALLDKSVKVLDKGFVRLVDYLGTDDRIVQAARVSYGAGTKTKKEDAALIAYLIAHGHTSPLEQVVMTFHMKLPIVVARQMIRHRVARLNEMSGRYSIMPNDAYVPEPSRFGKQSTTNKQGTGAAFTPEEQAFWAEEYATEQAVAFDNYNKRLTDETDMAREIARCNLPLSTYTEWYWQIDLNNMFKFMGLRLDEHAQWEIRQYAEAMVPMVKAVAPAAWAGFEEHVLHGAKLSRTDITAIRKLIDGTTIGLTGRALAEFNKKLGVTCYP